MAETFTLIVVDGSFLDVTDIGTDSVRFNGLTWEESVELARLSFRNGHEVVLWREETEG